MHPSYETAEFDPDKLSATVSFINKVISGKFTKSKYIAVCGISGLIVAGAISIRSKRKIIAIRKENEDAHSSRCVEFNEIGLKPGDTIHYVIIDDLISSGKTVEYIYNSIKLCQTPFKFICDGIILYNSYREQNYIFKTDKNEVKVIGLLNTKEYRKWFQNEKSITK